MSRTIAVVGGTGPQGSGLAQRWACAGERVIIGSRDAERARDMAARLSHLAGVGIEGAENAVAVRQADVIVLTVPFAAHVNTLKSLHDAFRPSAVLIDCTVPLASAVGGKATHMLGVWQGSAAEQAAELAPEHVKVAAAFQNIGSEALQGSANVECDVIVCSDDRATRDFVRQLAEKISGIRGIDGGKLENARIVEQITPLLITINIRYKTKHCGLRITGLP